MAAARSIITQALRPSVRHPFAKLGGTVWRQWHELRHTTAVIGTVLLEGLRPRNWNRAGRTMFSRQVLALGIEPLGFVVAVAGFVGISVVVQLSFWAGEAGQSQLLGPLLVAVVARELGPLLINLVVIVRSGGAMTTELGRLQNEGASTPLAAPGGDPLRQLVLPRVLGMAVATFSLTIVFTFVALASGFLFAAWLGKGSRDVLLFADTVAGSIQPKDIYNILAKSILPALFAGATCCVIGLGTAGPATELPAATQRALARSITGLLIISTVVSLLTYL
jgi:phospholipid/cholesterol/gamma-HCH transport system permease protein